MVKALKCCEYLPSIKGIQRIAERRNIIFSFATLTDVEQQLKNIKAKKASQDTDIQTRILNENSDFFAQFVLKNSNKVIAISTFPNMLKHTSLRPIYKNSPETKYKTIAQ